LAAPRVAVGLSRPAGHSGSRSSQAEIREAVQGGVVKLNLDTDAQYAFTRAIVDHILANREPVLDVERGKHVYDPRSWGREAEQGMAARVAEACGQLGPPRAVRSWAESSRTRPRSAPRPAR
jgi:fructose/tagatose bisphosphate aldolase